MPSAFLPHMGLKLKDIGKGVSADDLTKYFDDILISSDYHTKKPDKRFFHILLERHKLDVSHSLYIGNDSRCDVGGAKGVGMPVFYVNSNISPKNDDGKEADYIVENFCAWKEVTI